MFKNIEKYKYLVIMLIAFFVIIFSAPQVNAATLDPSETQKVKFIATELVPAANGKNQLTVEMWIENFTTIRGIDLVVNYDHTLLSTSDISTNEIIDVNESFGIPANFEFANGFENYIDLFSMSFAEGELRTIISVLPNVLWLSAENEYVKLDDVNGDYMTIPNEVLFGKFSFQVGEGKVAENSITLKADENNSPETGIKISVDGVDFYENPSMFEFILALASENANLSNLQTDLKPIDTFNKEVLAYDLILEEDSEKILIVPTPEDSTATIKIGEDIVDPSIGYEVILNGAGEDTAINIVVTAEDLETIKTYVITVKKPAGNIVGSISTYNWESIFSAPIKIYKKEQIDSLTVVVNETTGETVPFEWDTMKNHEALDTITPYKEFIINENGTPRGESESIEDYALRNGTFDEKVMIGTYDIIIDKPGYLDYVLTDVVITENGTIEFEHKWLIPGDCNKDGEINMSDLIELNNRYALTDESDSYHLMYDLTEDKNINMSDLIELNKNYGSRREVINIEEKGE